MIEDLIWCAGRHFVALDLDPASDNPAAAVGAHGENDVLSTSYTIG